MIRLIETRARWDDEVRAPPLRLVKTVAFASGNLDTRDPFHMFLAEVPGTMTAQESVTRRKGSPFIS